MSTSVVGRVVDDAGNGIAGLAVVVRCESDLFPSDLGTATTDGSGAYTVAIQPDRMTDVFGTRTLGVYVRTGVFVQNIAKGRLLYSTTYPDIDADTLTVPNVLLHDADVTGWPVSLPGTANALPVRAGNALRPLVDDQVAWQHLAASMSAAQHEICLMQLEFDLPQGPFNADATAESPEIVLAFPDGFDGTTPPTTANDPNAFPRPERLLLGAAATGRTVRVMLPRTGNIFGRGAVGGAGKVAGYFSAAGSAAQTLTFTTQGASVVHAKAVLLDAVEQGGLYADDGANAEGILLGSPFSQSYWDTPEHKVYEARRGSCSGEPIPVHDVSLGFRGPVVADLQAQFAVHWNTQCTPAGPAMPVLTSVPAAITTGGIGEYVASAQLVRTVNHDTLPGLPNGEQGILEAYLRAIEKATDYIYFENQYLTNKTVSDALTAALLDPARPNLQVILLVNVVPDIPFYPAWQTNLIGRIRRDAGAAAARLGVFTTWSHAAASASDHPGDPVIMPNYLHTKTAIVDGKWATIGSGNLDGASLDQFQVLQAILGLNRNDELNLLVFNDPPDYPQTDFVDQLRLSLWSEHLGLAPADSQLSASTLSTGTGGWLQLWNDCATAKLEALIDDPTVVDPTKGRVLAYPADAWSGFMASLPGKYGNYHNFLENAKIGGRSIDLAMLNLVTQTTAFGFHDGKWADS